MKVKSESEVAQSCPTLCDPMDCSLPGSSVHGIFQARMLGVGCHFLLQCMKVKSENEVAQSCLTLSDPMDCSLPGSSVHGFSRQGYWSGVPLPSSSDKIDLKIKKITRDKEGHYIIIKGSIQEEDITIVNICAPNTGEP